MADRNAAVPYRFKVSDHARKNIVLAYKTWPIDVATRPRPVGIVTLKTARLCDDHVRSSTFRNSRATASMSLRPVAPEKIKDEVAALDPTRLAYFFLFWWQAGMHFDMQTPFPPAGY